MSTFTIEVELLAGLRALGVTDAEIQREKPTLIVLQKFREGAISTGKAAELLGMTRVQFLELLAKEKIALIDYSVEELEQEMKLVRELTQKG